MVIIFYVNGKINTESSSKTDNLTFDLNPASSLIIREHFSPGSGAGRIVSAFHFLVL